MTQSGYASEKDLQLMAAQHDAWLEGVNTSHIQPLDDNWQDHPFWADEAAVKNPDTPAGKVIEEMQSEFTPQERAESCKVSGQGLNPNVILVRVEEPHRGMSPVQAAL